VSSQTDCADETAAVSPNDAVSTLQRDFLTRICKLATAALGVGESAVFVRSSADGTFAPVAHYARAAAGDGPAQSRTLRARVFQSLLSQVLEREVVTASVSSDGPATPAEDGPTYIAVRDNYGLLGAGVGSRVDNSQADRTALSHDIASVAALGADVITQLEGLERRDALKSDVLGMASHELRDVLQTMVISHRLLRASLGLSEIQGLLIGRLEQGTQRLLELVQGLLEVGRSDAAQIPLNVDELAIGDWVVAIAADAESQPRLNSNVRVTWTVEDGLPRVRTDEAKLRIVLRNLLHNALKFTTTGTVAVRVYSKVDGVVIEVADSGLGIDDATRAVMFDAFSQGSEGLRSASGSGLGLYIVKRLLQMLEGRVEVRSAPQQGTTVQVWLPRSIMPVRVGI